MAMKVKTVLDIRSENERLIKTSPETHAARYRKIAAKFGVSEWSARWICQGREYENIGGYIETTSHESKFRRPLLDEEVLGIREEFLHVKDVFGHADNYGVSPTTIARLLLGKTYRNVGGPVFTRKEVNACLNNKWQPYQKAIHTPVKPPVLLSVSVEAVEKDETRAITKEESKLSNMDIFFIRNGYKNGDSIDMIQTKYKLSKESVLDIIDGSIFTDKPGPIQWVKVYNAH